LKSQVLIVRVTFTLTPPSFAPGAGEMDT